MKRSTSKQPARWAVILDADDPRARAAHTWRDASVHEVHDEASLHATLGALLDAGVEVAVVQGGDRFLARAITAHRQRWSGHATSLRWLPMNLSAEGLTCEVAETLKVPAAPAKAAREIARAAARGRLDQTTVQTLRVTSSLEPTWQLAFNVGVGQLYDLFEARARSPITALGTSVTTIAALAAEVVAARPHADARVAIDATPHPRLGWMLMGALPRGWFGLTLSRDGGPHLLDGPSLRALAPALARARAPLHALRAAGATPFERVHLDRLDGYVLDGELRQPARPHILQVARGVLTPCATLP